MDYDIAIIGGGVVGCAILHELTSRGLSCILCEQEEEILTGASAGNSGTLHTGFDASPNSLELTCLERARGLNEQFFRDYKVPFKVSGAYVVAWNKEDLQKLPGLLAKFHANGVLDAREVSREELREKEPHLNADALGAVYIPKETIVDPWMFPVTVAHVAICKGGKIERDFKIENAKAIHGGWRLSSYNKSVTARVVINCAGLFGDVVENFNRKSPFTIKPRKGQYAIFSQSTKSLLNAIIFPVPTERTKGVLLFPTVYGNIVIGPTAEDQSDRITADVKQEVIAELIDKAYYMLPSLREHEIVGTYAGLRPATEHKDYQIENERDWIMVGGIRSTGLSSCLGIAKYVADLLQNRGHLQRNSNRYDINTEKPVERKWIHDGSIEFAGRKWKITHPLTILGFSTTNGLAKLKSHL